MIHYFVGTLKRNEGEGHNMELIKELSVLSQKSY